MTFTRIVNKPRNAWPIAYTDPARGQAEPDRDRARIRPPVDFSASATLQARQREIFHLHEQALAREIAATASATSDQLEPRVIAAAVLGTMRALWEREVTETADGRPHSSPKRSEATSTRASTCSPTGLSDYGRS